MSANLKLVQSVQLRIYKISKQYKKRNSPIEFSQLVENASQVLVCLPNKVPTAPAAFQCVEKISNIFQHWKITLLSPVEGVPKQTTKYSIVAYSSDDLTRADKPKKELLQKFSNAAFDIAIDLSIPFNFTNIVALWKSEALLRIGFYHPVREAFYNFLLRLNNDSAYDNAYQSLLKYLESFQAETVPSRQI